MRLVTYVAPGENPRVGVVAKNHVFDLPAGAAALGVELPTDMVSFLARGEQGLATAERVAAAGEAGRLPGWPEHQVRLVAAVLNPPKLLLLAGNYQAHIVESGATAVDKRTINPRPFIKPGTAVIGTGDPIKLPPDSNTIDYELEIAAVIGRLGRLIPVDAAEAHVAGYVIFNDVSARNLTIAEGRTAREGDAFFDWLLGKWCDTFAAVGPYLVTRDEAGDPNRLEMALRVNGDLKQHSSAGEMIFSIPEAISFISRFVTLQPGDLVCMGTPGGVGDVTETYLKPGDVVEAEIERLGHLINPVE